MANSVKRQRIEAELDSIDDSTDLLDWLAPGAGEKENTSDWLGPLSPVPGPEGEADGEGAADLPTSSIAAPAEDFSEGVLGEEAPPSLAGLSAPPPGPAAAPAAAAQPSEAEASAPLLTSMGRGPAAATPQELESLVVSLPPSYGLTTSNVERELHVRMLKQLRADGPQATVTSWVPMQDAAGRPLVRLHAVFHDRCAVPRHGATRASCAARRAPPTLLLLRCARRSLRSRAHLL
jgi:hypothetical protein